MCSCHPCHLPHPLVAIAIAIFVAFAVACPPLLSPLPSPCRPHPLCHSLIALAIVLIVACRCCCCHHHPHCHSPTTCIAIAIVFATVPIAIALACHPHHRCNHPLCCLCLHLSATLVAVTPPLGGGRGGPYQSSTWSNFGCRCRCGHHRHCLCQPHDRPGGAGQTLRGHSAPSSGRVPKWRGCYLCVAGVILHTYQQQWWQSAMGSGCGIGNVATKLIMLDKPVSQKLPVARCYGTYVMNCNTSRYTLYNDEV